MRKNKPRDPDELNRIARETYSQAIKDGQIRYDKEGGCYTLQSLQNAKKELLKLQDKWKFEKMMGAAAIITELLEKEKIRPIIVGGLSVEIYSMEGYATQDIDFVLNGFEKASELFFRFRIPKDRKKLDHT
jgi:hypothetical protein